MKRAKLFTALEEPSSADPEFATQLQGDLAEEVRSFLADKHKCRPPGLQTIVNSDKSITVKANCPEQGITLEVSIGPLAGAEAAPPPPEAPPTAPPADQMGITPAPMDQAQLGPAPMDPSMQMGPPAPGMTQQAIPMPTASLTNKRQLRRELLGISKQLGIL